MQLPSFNLERYFARWEFVARYILCSSDAETMRLDELLDLADDECCDLWNNLTLGYTESPGHPLLRAEIAALYDSIDAGDVLTFAGAEEGIFALVNVLLGHGDHAVVTWPAYQSLYEVTRSTGADVTLLKLNESDRWVLDTAALEAALQPNTRLIVINSPHNPTGAHLDDATLRAIVDIADRHGAYLLCDEVYRLLEHRESDLLPAGCDLSSRALSLGVMSKAFGLAGLRVGWLASRDSHLLRRVAAFKDYTTICNSAPSEVLALIALRARKEILSRNRSIVTLNLVELDRFFEKWSDDLTWVRPRAGSVAFPRLLREQSIDEFAATLVEKTGVLIAPGSLFDHPGNHFRIGFGRANMPEALGRLDEFLEATASQAR